eukprot:jgi/Chlat1/4156/Chrsp27S04261
MGRRKAVVGLCVCVWLWVRLSLAAWTASTALAAAAASMSTPVRPMMSRACPYTMWVESVSDPTTSSSETYSLPEVIYLDNSTTYSFLVKFKPLFSQETASSLLTELRPCDSPFELLSSLQLTASVQPPQFVEVKVVRRLDLLEMVAEFSVTLTELGQAWGFEVAPATAITLTAVSPAGGVEETLANLTVLSTPNCATNGADICCYFDDILSPIASLTLHSLPHSNYTLPYSLIPVATGPSLSHMAALSPQESARFGDGGRRPMYAIIGCPAEYERGVVSDGAVREMGCSITFVCSQGSPCAGIIPHFPLPPSLFIAFALSSLDSYSESYCTLRGSVTVRLFGTPPSIGVAAAPTFSTLGGLLLVSLGVFVVLKMMRPGFRQGIHFELMEAKKEN